MIPKDRGGGGYLGNWEAQDQNRKCNRGRGRPRHMFKKTGRPRVEAAWFGEFLRGGGKTYSDDGGLLFAVGDGAVLGACAGALPVVFVIR